MALMKDEESSKYKIPIFVGFNQGRMRTQLLAGETIDAQNIVVDDGDIAVTAGCSKYVATALTAGIKTLMAFYLNASDGTQSKILLAATASAIYKWDTGTSAWVSLKSGLSNGQFDFINYQEGVTDLIIVGNGTDASMKWNGTDASFAALAGTPTPPKFSSVALHYERVWCLGDKAAPNTVNFSNMLDPEDWNTETVNGAGLIEIPTWDNGVCIGIASIFDDVVIFKTRNIFKIVGTYPGEYAKYNVYSTTGAIAERSIVNYKNTAFFLTREGIFTYNGTSATLISNPIKDIIASMNLNYANLACAVCFNNKYILAIPTGSSTVNDTVIEFDLIKETFIVKKGISVTTWLDYDNKLLFANDTVVDSKCYVYQYNSGTTFYGTAISAYWETPDTDWDAPDAKKTCSYIHFTAKGSGSLKIDAIFNDKGTVKTVSATVALSATDKVYKVRLKNKGRRFKFKFSNVSGSYFKLSNPIISMDVDYD